MKQKQFNTLKKQQLTLQIAVFLSPQCHVQTGTVLCRWMPGVYIYSCVSEGG